MNPISNKLLRSLRELFPETHLLTGTSNCLAYGFDNSRQQAMPIAVCFAENTEQIKRLVQACRDYKVPLVTRGKATGTTGATTPEQGGIVLSMERFRQRLNIDSDNRIAIVSPGFTNQELQDVAGEQGFFWPPDPTSAAVCTIGGNLAYNSAGPSAVKYGTPRENTLGLSVVTGHAENVNFGVKTTKGVVGYDFTRLLIGSEGTLGIITEAILKLTPKPQTKMTLRAIYRSMEAAAQAVSAIMAQPTTPCTLEFMDGQAIHMARHHANLDLPEQAAAILMIEVDGTQELIEHDVQRVQQAAQHQECIEINVAKTKQEISTLWQARKALSPALRHIAPKKINEDVAVPVSRLPELISGLQKLAHQHGITIVNFGHAGNGNIHVNLLFDPSDAAQSKASQACLNGIFELVLALEGTLSGEHGVGRAKRDFIAQELDEHNIQLMHAVKKQFDPDNILNPGVALPKTNILPALTTY